MTTWSVGVEPNRPPRQSSRRSDERHNPRIGALCGSGILVLSGRFDRNGRLVFGCPLSVGGLFVVGQEAIELAASIAEDLGSLSAARLRRTRPLDLHGSLNELHRQLWVLAAITLRVVPAGMRCHRRCGDATALAQRVRPSTIDLLARHESLVGELLKGWVDGAGTRPPPPTALCLELLDHLVAVLAGGSARERPDLTAADLCRSGCGPTERCVSGAWLLVGGGAAGGWCVFDSVCPLWCGATRGRLSRVPVSDPSVGSRGAA